MTLNYNTIKLLQELAEKYETKEFILEDPSQFMHHYSNPKDQEVMAFIASCLSFGQRKQFLKKIELIEKEMNGEPYNWLMERRFETSNLFLNKEPDSSFYRMVTYADLLQLLRLMASEEHNLFDFFRSGKARCNIETIQKHWATPHLVPKDAKSTCKRLHMFMRWMVRTNSPVDLGIWSNRVEATQLIIPLDTHVLQESIRLGLIAKGSPTLKTAKEITKQALQVFPNDPVRIDFALFGLGVDKEKMI